MPAKTFLKNNLFFLTTLAVAAFPLWPMKMTVYVIGCWFFSAVYEHIRFNVFPSTRNLRWMLISIALYVFYLLTLLWSQSGEAFHTVERKFALLVFPLGFYLFRRNFTAVQYRQVLQTYQLANLLLAVYLYVRLAPMLIEYRELLTIEGFNYAFRKAVENISGIHPTYLSILFLFSIFIQTERIRKREMTGRIEKLLSHLHFVLLLPVCVLLTARGPILSFMAAYLILLFLRNWKKGLVLTLATAACMFFTIVFFPVVGNRFAEVIQAEQVTSSDSTVNSANIRLSIYQCTTELIRSNWLSGVGPDQLQKELNQCYERYNNPLLMESNYNSHNQYFDVWLSLGIFGLFLFILMLAYPLYRSFMDHREVFLFFILFISFCFFTENLLSRQYGVVFFAFFNAFFAQVFFNQKEERRSW